LEITAAGAAGIYSGVPPYAGHVQQGQNGILVQDSNSQTEWREAIESATTWANITSCPWLPPCSAA
jgi:hypothetical protein